MDFVCSHVIFDIIISSINLIVFVDVELNAMIIAASQAGKPLIAEKLKHLRGVWQGYNRYGKEREAKEAALMQEVERVDRTAAKISMETQRLKKLRDEAMDIVKRVEPGLVESPHHSRATSARSFTQDDDMLYLNKDLKQVRDLILSENFHDDAEPKLTDMMSRNKNISGLRRHASYGSLLQSSPGPMVPPPMPLLNNYYGHHDPQSPYYPPPPPSHYPYEDQFGYYPYPPMYADMYYDHHQHHRKYSHQRRGHRHHHKYDRDMSSEGENTSNDACDLSSSEASGSGRRRKNKSMSPKPPLIPRQDKSVHQTRKSPQDKLMTNNRSKPLKASTPKKEELQPIEDLNLDLNVSADLSEVENSYELEDKNDQIQGKVVVEPPSKVETELVHQAPDPDLKEKRKAEDPPVTAEKLAEKAELKRVESEQNFMIESGEENNKLYSSETESSDKQPPVAKKSSVDRERKVGVGLSQNPSETNAYQQMLLGGARKPPAPTLDDETSSDDIEAQLAVQPVTRPRSSFLSGGTMHEDEDSLNKTPPQQTLKTKSQPSAEAAEPLRIAGMGGHPMPLAFGVPGAQTGLLSGGKLGHPLAQRVGMMALSSNNDAATGHNDDTGNLSAPDNDDDDDFWS